MIPGVSLRYLIGSLAVALFCISCFPSSSPSSRNRIGQNQHYGEIVMDPYEFVLGSPENWKRHHDFYTYDLTRFFLDLNEDGQHELFISSPYESGTGGQNYHIFTKLSDGVYREIGNARLGAISFGDGRNSGFRDFWTWNRTGGTEDKVFGPTILHKWDGDEYQEIVEGESYVRELDDLSKGLASRGKSRKIEIHREVCVDYSKPDWIPRERFQMNR
ncbi:MAG: hypothetical protein NTX50_30745 [Candidatus Sumerlaeota bacterium]|nr:hypothetical protein [Candidatus Sumerlaeota bacterium]